MGHQSASFRANLRLIESLEPLVLMSATSLGEVDGEPVADEVAEIAVFHRDGQTFITWQEDTSIAGEEYHVYRHTEAINEGNLAAAEKLTAKWGPLDEDTSVHQSAGAGAPEHFVLSSLAAELSDDVGLFVYTTQAGEAGNAFYAVTVVINGVEQPLGSSVRTLPVGVAESVAATSPILVNSVNDGKGQVFTHFMDYKAWNPTFNGYAYNYAVALPDDFDLNVQYGLRLELHAYSEPRHFLTFTESNWQTIQLFVDDPGAASGSIHSWWYGYAADHNYNTDGPIPVAGVIENFTEQRVLQAVDEVIALHNVDDTRINIRGHSMGASGALSLGIHYGDIFSGIYASEGMTDYAASPEFQSEFEQLWGTQQSNLLIVNNGPHATSIAKYGASGSDPTGVWNWLDHGEQLIRRRGETIAFLMFGHGKADRIIDWATQGEPFIASVEAANVGYSAEHQRDISHAWMGFGFAVHSLFSAGYPDLGEWMFENDSSHLALTNNSNSGPNGSGPDNIDEYNLTIDWATTWNPFHTPIVDTADQYEISIRSLTADQIVDVTPRNFQTFDLLAGQTVQWQNRDNTTGQILQQGQVVVDSDGLLTITQFQVRPNLGSRMILSLSDGQVTPLPVVSVQNIRVNEGNSGTTQAELVAQLSRPTDVPVTVRYQTRDQSATAGQDYVASSGTVVIPTGETSLAIPVQIIGEDLLEADETFQVSLSEAVNALLGTSTAQVVIANDDQSTGGGGDPTPTPPSPTASLVGSDLGEWISGTEANDIIDALGGNDEIHASVGNNTIDGGDGEDTFVVYEGTSSDFQVVRYSDGTVIVSGVGVNGGPVTNRLRNIERISFNDRILLTATLPISDPPTNSPTDPTGTGTAAGEWISATAGNDVISGGGGNDEIHAPIGNNLIDGGTGFDSLVIYEGDSTKFQISGYADGSYQVTGPGINGQPVTNTLRNVERVVFNDVIVNLDTILITNGPPAEPPVGVLLVPPVDPPDEPSVDPSTTIVGTSASEWISGSAANDIIDARAGDDEIHASQGENLIDGGSGFDTLIIYEGLRSDYVITFLANGSTRLVGPGINGIPVVNELLNVERIVFNDTELRLT